MEKNALADTIKNILGQRVRQEAKAARIPEAIRNAGAWRWVGLYAVDYQSGLVTNITWSGLGPPAYPSFPITRGLTARAITGRKSVNVGDVTKDPDYLAALGSTRSEMIVPIFDETGHIVIGTIDVESEHRDAFDSAAQDLLEECASLLRGFWPESNLKASPDPG
jgi:L-methionine (R)-S-oxide reductase